MSVLLYEDMVAIREVPRLLPRRPNGNPLHISCIYRWVNRGVRGVRLEAVVIGGTMYTSKQALERFAQVKGAMATNQAPQTVSRQKQQERAARAAAEILSSGLNSK